MTDKDEIDLKALADGMREIWKIVNTEPFKSYIDWNSGTSLSNIDLKSMPDIGMEKERKIMPKEKPNGYQNP